MKWFTAMMVMCAILVRVVCAATSDPPPSESLSRGLPEDDKNLMKATLRNVRSIDEWPRDAPNVLTLIVDPDRRLRWDASTAIIGSVGRQERTLPDRQRLLDLVVDRLDDTDELVRQTVESRLLWLRPQDFGPYAVGKLLARLDKRRDWHTIMLAGLVDPHACLRRVGFLLDHPLETEDNPLSPQYISPVWAVMLVSARSGNEDSVRRVLAVVESEPHVGLRFSRLFPLVSLVPHAETVSYLREYLFSEQWLGPPGPTQSRYAERAALTLSMMLDGFPRLSSRYSATADDIQRCREWMRVQHEWKFIHQLPRPPDE